MRKKTDLYPWTKTALYGADDRERTFKRHLNFVGQFAHPATTDDLKYYHCISCETKDAELYRTYFEGGTICAWMCLSCITTAYQRVKKFMEERAFAA